MRACARSAFSQGVVQEVCLPAIPHEGEGEGSTFVLARLATTTLQRLLALKWLTEEAKGQTVHAWPHILHGLADDVERVLADDVHGVRWHGVSQGIVDQVATLGYHRCQNCQ